MLFHIHPNPASDVLHVELAAGSRPVEAVQWIEPLGAVHPVRWTSTPTGLICDVRDLPRGHGVFHLRSGPIVFRCPLVLH